MTTTYMKSEIPVLFFEEGDKIVAYSPALDISTCGNTEEQARKRFAETTSIFFRELVDMGTLDDVLTECGWRKTSSTGGWSPPVYRRIREESIKIPIRG